MNKLSKISPKRPNKIQLKSEDYCLKIRVLYSVTITFFQLYYTDFIPVGKTNKQTNRFKMSYAPNSLSQHFRP